MISVNVKIEGLEEMKRMLKVLPDEVKVKALRPSVRDMGGVILGWAIAASPYRKGALRRNIRLIRAKTTTPWEEWNGLRVKTARKKTMRLGIEEGTGTNKTNKAEVKGANDPWYWFFQEFGFHPGGGSKKVPEKKFLRNALEQHVAQTGSAFNRAFTDKLYAVTKRLAAQQRRSLKSRGSIASMSSRTWG